MNRSAKAGARSSLQYGGEGVLTHPAHQGVCGRHGREVMNVTQGGLGESLAQGARQAGAISEERSDPVGSSSSRRVAKYQKRRQQKLRDRRGGLGSSGKATREGAMERK
jgi:hypothetical protein